MRSGRRPGSRLTRGSRGATTGCRSRTCCQTETGTSRANATRSDATVGACAGGAIVTTVWLGVGRRRLSRQAMTPQSSLVSPGAFLCAHFVFDGRSVRCRNSSSSTSGSTATSPSPTCGARRRSWSSTGSRRSRSCRSGASTAVRRGRPRAATPTASSSRSRSSPIPARTNGVLVMCEVLLPDGTPHPSNSRATIPDDPDTWFGFEQEYFFYVGRLTARLPGGRRLPGAAGRVLHGRRPQERRLARARDRRGAPRPLPGGGDQPRGHQRRGREGPVGVPDLRQGLEAGSRRDVDRALPAAPPLRALRRRRQLALQAARRRRRLERLRHAHELLDEARCARSAARSTSWR